MSVGAEEVTYLALLWLQSGPLSDRVPELIAAAERRGMLPHGLPFAALRDDILRAAGPGTLLDIARYAARALRPAGSALLDPRALLGIRRALHPLPTALVPSTQLAYPTCVMRREVAGRAVAFPTAVHSSYRKLKSVQGHMGPVYNLRFSADGTLLYSGADDFNVKVWDTRSARLLNTLRGHGGAITDLALLDTPGSRQKRLVSACTEGQLRVWDAANGCRFLFAVQLRGRVNSLAFSPNPGWPLLLVVQHTGVWSIWDVVTGLDPKEVFSSKSEAASAFPSMPRAFTANWSFDGSMFVIEGSHALVFSWDGQQPVFLKKFDDQPAGAIFAVFANKRLSFVTGGSKVGTAFVYHYRPENIVDEWQSIPLDLKTNSKKKKDCAICWSSDDAFVIAASGDGTVRVFDALAGTNIHKLVAHTMGEVWSIASHPLDPRIVLSSSSADRKIVIWDIVAGERIAEHTRIARPYDRGLGALETLFSPDGRYFAASDMLGMLHLYGTDPPECYAKTHSQQFFMRELDTFTRDDPGNIELVDGNVYWETFPKRLCDSSFREYEGPPDLEEEERQLSQLLARVFPEEATAVAAADIAAPQARAEEEEEAAAAERQADEDVAMEITDDDEEYSQSEDGTAESDEEDGSIASDASSLGDDDGSESSGGNSSDYSEAGRTRRLRTRMRQHSEPIHQYNTRTRQQRIMEVSFRVTPERLRECEGRFEPEDKAGDELWLMRSASDKPNTYRPQIGDRVTYFAHGHRLYAQHFTIPGARLPFNTAVPDEIPCIVREIRYGLEPFPHCILDLEPLKSEHKSVDLTGICFHESPLPCFLVNTRLVRTSPAWRQEEVFQMYFPFNDTWERGVVIDGPDRPPNLQSTLWESVCVTWDKYDSIGQWVSPWEISKKRRGPETRKNSQMWGRIDQQTIRRFLEGLNLLKSKYLPVMAHALTSDRWLPYNVSYGLIRSRLRNNWYRSIDSLQHDLARFIDEAENGGFEGVGPVLGARFGEEMRRLIENVLSQIPDGAYAIEHSEEEEKEEEEEEEEEEVVERPRSHRRPKRIRRPPVTSVASEEEEEEPLTKRTRSSQHPSRIRRQVQRFVPDTRISRTPARRRSEAVAAVATEESEEEEARPRRQHRYSFRTPQPSQRYREELAGDESEVEEAAGEARRPTRHSTRISRPTARLSPGSSDGSTTRASPAAPAATTTTPAGSQRYSLRERRQPVVFVPDLSFLAGYRNRRRHSASSREASRRNSRQEEDDEVEMESSGPEEEASVPKRGSDAEEDDDDDDDVDLDVAPRRPQPPPAPAAAAPTPQRSSRRMSHPPTRFGEDPEPLPRNVRPMWSPAKPAPPSENTLRSGRTIHKPDRFS